MTNKFWRQLSHLELLQNEACERLISRLWWYKCYRGTLLREGTPPVHGVENEDRERLVKSVVKSPKRHKSPRRHQIAQEAANHIKLSRRQFFQILR